ncbi:MAG: leucine--tRNA ligase [Patescibacteria group bacterium]
MKSSVYDHKKIEEKWLKIFSSKLPSPLDGEGTPVNTGEGEARDKLYLLFAFPYPSGSGLHVGHVESKTALDILARYYRMNGKDVFFPVGWDAFGLPAENYAIKTGIHPAETTKNAINTFKRQIKRIGISYDWEREIAASHPGYYKWTQWLFLQLHKKGLAYQAMGSVNWCPSCQTVLANEQVVDGHCERCDTEVIQKEMKQWYFKITDYAEVLMSGLEQVDWPKPTVQQQLSWIGKKTGININYQVLGLKNDGEKEIITCFTTRPDTNFGATFIVLGPEHKLVSKILDQVQNDKKTEISKYIEIARNKKEIERLAEGKKKTGIFTGLYCDHPETGKKLPLFISDFVLGNVGTGAVVGVPGHDVRDFEFAQFANRELGEKVEIIRVVVASDGDKSPITRVEQVQEEEGTMVNSGFLDGLDIHEATQKIMDYYEKEGYGDRVVNYKLRDWLISRQRYWGAPIPIVYDPEGKAHPVKEEHLPWKLPDDVDFKPTGESPLRSSKELQERTEKLYGKGWTPEYDTMDTFVCSSWYYLRFTDPRNEKEFASKENLQKWMPVDFYMIGPEHIVLHLLYSRFFTKFLREEGYLDFDEPFLKMRHQGMILGPNGKKMSKSKGNVISPDDIVEKFGADTLRIYEMFMGPIEADKPWSTSAVAGIYRFLGRIHNLTISTSKSEILNSKIGLQRKLHQTIKKVSQDIPKLKFNTAIATMMEFVNVWEKASKDAVETRNGVSQNTLFVTSIRDFIKLLAPFAPFLAEELNFIVEARLITSVRDKNAVSIHDQDWPKWDEKLAQEEEITIPVQVNGKLRDQLVVETRHSVSQDEILQKAKKLPKIQKWLEGKKIIKEIYVPGKIINFVVK